MKARHRRLRVDITQSNTTLRSTMQVVAVPSAYRADPALAGVLARLADRGGLVVVHAGAMSACEYQPHELLLDIRSELSSESARVLLIEPTTTAALYCVAALCDESLVALVTVRTADPVPVACLLGDLVGADDIVLAAQLPTGLVLDRIRRPQINNAALPPEWRPAEGVA
jgi:hypothetical protein